jgi:hypothetical protein
MSPKTEDLGVRIGFSHRLLTPIRFDGAGRHSAIVPGMARVPSSGREWGRRKALDRSLLSLVLLLLLAAAPASAQDPNPAAPEGDSPQVALDQLLKLPSDYSSSVEKRGGLTAGEWRSRFNELRKALEAEKKGLKVSEADLERVAGTADAWAVGPPIPGMSQAASEAPLDYRIRHAINQHRAEIERLERQLRELEVEANLALVPEDWRE